MRRARVETAQIWGERYITQRRLNIPAFSSTFLSIFLLLLLFEDETEAFLSFSKEQCSDEEEELSRFRLYHPDILQ